MVLQRGGWCQMPVTLGSCLYSSLFQKGQLQKDRLPLPGDAATQAAGHSQGPCHLGLQVALTYITQPSCASVSFIFLFF